MTAICFVCNLPILSHQVGLVWAGGNGWDELTRSTLEETTLRQRLGNRRDSAAQVCCVSPPEPDVADQPRGGPRRRRSSLAQLTDILREWGGGGSNAPRRQRAPLSRRETLADLARSLPWARHEPPPRRRRDSSADSGIKSSASKRRDSKAITPHDFRSEFPTYLERKDSTIMSSRERRVKRRGSSDGKERRDSVDGHRHRRDSVAAPPPRVVATHKKRRASPPTPAPPSFVDASSDPGPSTHPPSVTVVTVHEPSRSDGECPPMTMPTIITSAVTPSPTSPTIPNSNASQTTQASQASQPTQATQVTPSGRIPPNLGGRRDSTTQCGRARRDSRATASPERRLGRLQRQATAFDDPNGPPGTRRRDSGPTLDPDDAGKARRDSLSPDSAARPRRERNQLSPDRAGGGGCELSPSAARRRSRLRRQASCARVGRARSPESSSCSSRDPSPCARPPERTMFRRQSTTEEILIARGFRRQSTTEEMIRCRNFRRQSSQSDDACMRARGRRDSSTQILDGTIGTMTVETTSTFFDSSTQTGI
ncbi:unnamed protein product [Euphydryas editha]|uniref:Uncharacterized protein n=1 Tax=Euphydryas editha TaxID=104508 RepID=A0AAU9TY89_EUPED|nr:unnamed protein product [Euphydryas editha]